MRVYTARPNPGAPIQALAQTVGVPMVAAALLVHRGMATADAARHFLTASVTDLSDPYELAGVPRAVEHLADAVVEGRHIVVHGDYDVDGMSGSAVLLRILWSLGAHATYYLPHRLRDGYGLTRAGLDRIKAAGGETIVTVDCGSGAIDPLRYARDELGLGIIASDHHLMAERPTPDFDVVSPQLDGRLTELSGAGVAFKLGMALLERLGRDPDEAYNQLDLAVLGEVADVVPLIGESRILVKEGLARLNRTSKPGLRALVQRARLELGHVTETDIGFSLAPLLNAAGRMADPHYALDLLLADDEGQAQILAHQLWGWNESRKTATAAAVQRAEALLDAHPQWLDEPVLVVADRDCPLGIAGLVAARLSERWHKPAIALAWHEGAWKGSARSTEALHLGDVLHKVREHLVKFGGHAKAAGLEVAADQVDALRAALARVTTTMPAVETDATLFDGISPLGSLTHPDMHWALERLAPFGEGNAPPLLLIRDCYAADVRQTGTGGDVTLCTLRQEETTVRAIGMHLPAQMPAGRVAGVMGTPQIHRFRGETSIQIRLVDVFPTQADLVARVRPATAQTAS